MPQTPHPSFTRNPLVGVCLVHLAGVAAGFALNAPPAAVAAVAAVAIAAVFFRPSHRAAQVACFLLVALCGWFNAWARSHPASGRHISAALVRPREQVAVTGVIVGDPVVEPAGRPGEWIHRFRLRVEAVERTGGRQGADGLVDVRMTGGRARAEYGDRWRVEGVLTLRDGLSPLRRRSVDGALETAVEDATCLGRGYGFRPLGWSFAARRACAVILGRGLDESAAETGILRALLLGCREEMDDDLYRSFARTGTLHVIAISGMHVAVLAALLVAVLRGLGLSRTFWVLYLAPALVAYTMLTGMSPSSVRACIMAGAFLLAPLLRRRPDGAAALALAALAMTVADPFQVAEPGFVFSFAAVAGLLAFYRRFMEPARRLLARDPWAPPDEAASPGWPRALAWHVAGLCAASLAAWLVTVPLTARYFNLVSPLSVVGNLVVVPLSFGVLVSGVLSLAAGWWWALAAEVFNHAARVMLTLMAQWTLLVERLPGSFCYVRAPSAILLLAWYAALLVLWRSRSLLRGATLLLALSVAVAALPGGNGFRLHALDVGQGNAVLFEGPGRTSVLLDCGPAYRADRVERYLRGRGVDRLDVLVLSHGDADHVGAAAELLRRIEVAEVWCTPFAAQSRCLRDALRAAAKSGARVCRRTAGESDELRGGVTWEVLHPPGGRALRRGGDASLVIRLAREGRAVLYMGGADGAVEGAIGRRAVDPAAPLLIAGDHGAPGTCDASWLDAVAPEVAVISVGSNAEGCPDPSVLQRLASRGIEVARTDTDGAVVVDVGADGPASRRCQVRSADRGTPSRLAAGRTPAATSRPAPAADPRAAWPGAGRSWLPPVSAGATGPRRAGSESAPRPGFDG